MASEGTRREAERGRRARARRDMRTRRREENTTRLEESERRERIAVALEPRWSRVAGGVGLLVIPGGALVATAVLVPHIGVVLGSIVVGLAAAASGGAALRSLAIRPEIRALRSLPYPLDLDRYLDILGGTSWRWTRLKLRLTVDLEHDESRTAAADAAFARLRGAQVRWVGDRILEITSPELKTLHLNWRGPDRTNNARIHMWVKLCLRRALPLVASYGEIRSVAISPDTDPASSTTPACDDRRR